MSDTISRQQAIDAVEKNACNTQRIMDAVNNLPPVQPERKGTRLSTVCLLCKKPAVTFNTEDDIPYTNYSYCEDCLRKGLKLLREQKKNLQTQPEQPACEYCHEDLEGYVKPIEKNGHAFVRFGMDGWELSLSAKGWHGGAKIRFCPMCGRKLRGEQDE